MCPRLKYGKKLWISPSSVSNYFRIAIYAMHYDFLSLEALSVIWFFQQYRRSINGLFSAFPNCVALCDGKELKIFKTLNEERQTRVQTREKIFSAAKYCCGVDMSQKIIRPADYLTRAADR